MPRLNRSARRPKPVRGAGLPGSIGRHRRTVPGDEAFAPGCGGRRVRAGREQWLFRSEQAPARINPRPTMLCRRGADSLPATRGSEQPARPDKTGTGSTGMCSQPSSRERLHLSIQRGCRVFSNLHVMRMAGFCRVTKLWPIGRRGRLPGSAGFARSGDRYTPRNRPAGGNQVHIVQAQGPDSFQR